MRECTFKPQTYSQKQKRNFGQFLNDQIQFQENKNKKQFDKQLQMMQEKENYYRKNPQLNKKSV